MARLCVWPKDKQGRKNVGGWTTRLSERCHRPVSSPTWFYKRKNSCPYSCLEHEDRPRSTGACKHPAMWFRSYSCHEIVTVFLRNYMDSSFGALTFFWQEVCTPWLILLPIAHIYSWSAIRKRPFANIGLFSFIPHFVFYLPGVILKIDRGY